MTDEMAKRTIMEYKDIQGLSTIEETIEWMEADYDDLDAEDRTAFKRFKKNPRLFDDSSDR